MPALKFVSVSLLVCVMGSRLLSTKSRYSELVLPRANSKPASALTRGVAEISTSTPIAGALKSPPSTVSCFWTNSNRSLFVLANIHPERKPIIPLGGPNRKSGDGCCAAASAGHAVSKTQASAATPRVWSIDESLLQQALEPKCKVSTKETARFSCVFSSHCRHRHRAASGLG